MTVQEIRRHKDQVKRAGDDGYQRGVTRGLEWAAQIAYGDLVYEFSEPLERHMIAAAIRRRILSP